jgi:hypothetical protein
MKFEIINGLTGEAGFTHSNVSDMDLNRTPAWMLVSKNVLSFSLSYGI